jgi:hypothetical protein
MRDLDSAVGRLDNLFMSIYVIVAVLIMAVTLVGTLFCTLIIVHRSLVSRKPNSFRWSPRLAL